MRACLPFFREARLADVTERTAASSAPHMIVHSIFCHTPLALRTVLECNKKMETLLDSWSAPGIVEKRFPTPVFWILEELMPLSRIHHSSVPPLNFFFVKHRASPMAEVIIAPDLNHTQPAKRRLAGATLHFVASFCLLNGHLAIRTRFRFRLKPLQVQFLVGQIHSRPDVFLSARPHSFLSSFENFQSLLRRETALLRMEHVPAETAEHKSTGVALCHVIFRILQYRVLGPVCLTPWAVHHIPHSVQSSLQRQTLESLHCL
mmetsp:Transcript_21534/g.42757  ORF Transcript_21534/g.42757 Transcript_21534/m.42757 type:complete len:262 (-) Transcript_21534:225-1010(-)